MTVNAHRPTIAVTRHAIAAGHYLASTAGFDILQAGGNAIDAGVAAGIALGVLQSDMVNCAGVAPIMIYLAEKQEVVTIAGLGTWPKALDPELFMREHGGKIPLGVLRTVVPAAPDAKAGAMKPRAEPSSGEPLVIGGFPAARVAARACTWLGGRPVKPVVPGPSQSSISASPAAVQACSRCCASIPSCSTRAG